MKTKFTDLIKLQEKKIETLEREIKVEYSKIGGFERMADEVREEILEIEYPDSGTNFSAFRQMNIAMHNMKSDIGTFEKAKDSSKKRIAEIKLEIQNRDRELKKFKYLENEILKKELKKREQRERAESDEIASILYNIKSKGLK
jgi:flagellar biosynthesis chaperone FliJ